MAGGCYMCTSAAEAVKSGDANALKMLLRLLHTFALQPYAVLSWSSMMSMLCQSTQADQAGLHNNAECNMQNSNPLPTFAVLHLQCSAVLPPVVSAVLPVLPAPTLLHCCQLGAKSEKVAEVSPPGQNRQRKTS